MYKSKIIDPELSAQENWERICQHKEKDPTNLPVVSGIEVRHQKFIQRSYQLAIAQEVINEEHTPGWKADYQEENYKTEPWFEIEDTPEKPGGAGFSCSAYGHQHSYSSCGSRLAAPHEEVTFLMQKAFEEFYLDVWTIPSN